MAKHLQLFGQNRTVTAVLAVAFVLVIPLVQAQIAADFAPVVSAASSADAPAVMQATEIDWP